MMNKSCVPSFHRRPFNKFLGRISVKYFILDKSKRMKKHPYDRNIPLETYYLVIDLILNNYFLQILKLSYYPNQCCDEKDLLTLSQYSSVCLWAQRMVGLQGYPSVEQIGVEKTQGVATQFYGLGTMNIAPLHGRTSLTTKVWVRSLGTVLERCQAHKTARLVCRLPFIVSYVLILLKAHSTWHINTHTHTHTYTHTLAYI